MVLDWLACDIGVQVGKLLAMKRFWTEFGL